MIFGDGQAYPARLKKQDGNLGLGIYAVERSAIADATWAQIETAKLGSSKSVTDRGSGDCPWKSVWIRYRNGIWNYSFDAEVSANGRWKLSVPVHNIRSGRKWKRRTRESGR